MFDYYESLGVLEVTLTTLPDTQPNDPVLTNMFMYQAGDPHVQLWRNEPISVNDCFLKNMNMYRYIVNIDTDEVIVPSNEAGPTWVEMMESLEKVTKNQARGKIITTVSKRRHYLYCLGSWNLVFPEFLVPGWLAP